MVKEGKFNMNLLENLIDKQICISTIRKSNMSRIKYLIECSISNKIDMQIVNLIAEYSMYDIHSISKLKESEILYNIWECIKCNIDSKTLEIIVDNLIFDNATVENTLSKDNFKYTRIMNILEMYHKWLAKELHTNKIVRKQDIIKRVYEILAEN